MTEPNAIRDNAPSPWWPCPECGNIHFRTTVVFERGAWVDEETWQAFSPASARPSSVATDVECVSCGHRFEIGDHYGWPTQS